MISPVHIWREATGGGLPVDFLRWLAAQWELYTAAQEHISREDFEVWLAGRFADA